MPDIEKLTEDRNKALADWDSQHGEAARTNALKSIEGSHSVRKKTTNHI